MRLLYVCPQCGARRTQLFLGSDGCGIVCRGVRCGNLRYESEYELKHPACSLDRIKELLKRSKNASTRRQRDRWKRKAEAAYEVYCERRQRAKSDAR
jgi:hypothetical protein